jgi:hypothetical protein
VFNVTQARGQARRLTLMVIGKIELSSADSAITAALLVIGAYISDSLTFL